MQFFNFVNDFLIIKTSNKIRWSNGVVWTGKHFADDLQINAFAGISLRAALLFVFHF